MQQVDVFRFDADAAYQGAPGAYSEEAAQVLLGSAARLMPCATLEQTFEAVADGRAAHAVVPVENAVSGTVPQVYELMLSHELFVTGETAINIDYVLVAPRGTTRHDIARVLSHPLALAQCSDFFRQNRRLEAVSVFDTAGAVRLAAESGDRRTAAIASRRAAALYGGEILVEHIQDFRENWNRFLLLAAGQPEAAGVDATKAIVACQLRHEPGALVQALHPIAANGLSITKIEGRPLAGTGFEYRFVVEMIAPPGRTIPASVYDELRAVTQSFALLGAFRAGAESRVSSG